jgi:hypothetical protein
MPPKLIAAKHFATAIARLHTSSACGYAAAVVPTRYHTQPRLICCPARLTVASRLRLCELLVALKRLTPGGSDVMACALSRGSIWWAIKSLPRLG